MSLKYVRLGNRSFSDLVRGSQKRRQSDKSIIDQTIVLDNEWKKDRHRFDEIKKSLNKLSKIINKFKKYYSSKLFARIISIKKKMIKIEKFSIFFQEKRNLTDVLIGNLIHNNSSFGNLGKNSRLDCISKNDFLQKPCNLFNHEELLKKIKGVDYEKGRTISGNRGYFLKGIGLLLNNSLLRYSIDFLIKRNFIGLQTPFFIIKSLLTKCSQLDDFKGQLYGLIGDEEKYLIATSEQPISCFHSNEIITKKNLPIKYVGFSTCFRKESGSHGKDTSGIFRVHQFEKVEQFVICNFKDLNSWNHFEELLENVKNFYSSIDVPFKLLNISSQSLNASAAKKIDLLGFFPKSNTFKELVSCSNCTQFQSKRLGVRIQSDKKDIYEKPFPHMLNSTLCATSRVLCCLVENYQTNLGILVPNVLRNYIGLSFIPYKKLNTN